MFKCARCGNVFDQPSNRYNKPVDEWDEDAACPDCYCHDFTIIEKCVECGAVKEPDELVNGWCEDCVKREAEKVLTVAMYGEATTDPVIINGLLAFAFSEREIEEILLRELLNSGKASEYASQYATDDTDMFTEWLNERRTEE